LTHNLPTTEAEKIIKFENLNLEIKYIWKLNNIAIYPSVISAERAVTKTFLKHLQNIGLTKNILRVGLRAALKFSIKNKEMEEHKRKPIHEQFY
jgi:hypothetical protein